MNGPRDVHDAAPAALPPQPPYVWIELAISKNHALLVMGRARLVVDAHQKHAIPYGFRWSKSTFHENGQTRFAPGEIGFTCSTIVAAVLAAEGIQLIDPEQWPPPDRADKENRAAYIKMLRRDKPELSNDLDAMAPEIDAPRIAPDEVVAAAAVYPISVGTYASLLDDAAYVRSRFTWKYCLVTT